MAGGKRLAAIALPKLGPGLHADGDGLYFRSPAEGEAPGAGCCATSSTDGAGITGWAATPPSACRRPAKEPRARQTLARGEDPIEARHQAKALSAARSASASRSTNRPRRTSPPSRRAGRTQSIVSSGRTHSRPTPPRCWARSNVGEVDTRRGAQGAGADLADQARDGEPPARPDRGVLDWATARGLRRARTRRAGAVTSSICCRRSPRRARSSTTPPCPTPRSASSWKLRKADGTAARALEFTILTAARTGEVLGARWDEIDLKAGLWIVPAERMKARREHRVPLSRAGDPAAEGQARSGRTRSFSPAAGGGRSPTWRC